MKHLKVIAECDKVIADYQQRIEMIQMKKDEIKKKCRISETVNRNVRKQKHWRGWVIGNIKFDAYSDDPKWLHIDSQNFNDIWGSKISRKGAIRLRNYLNMFIKGTL